MMRARNHVMGFWRCTRGVAAIELAIMLPLLVVIMLGTLELGRAYFISQKTRSLSFSIADYSTQDFAIDPQNLYIYTTAATQSMAPFPFNNTNGGIILTSMEFDDTQNRAVIRQQYKMFNTGNFSHLGLVNDTPNLPVALAMASGDKLVAVEVFYNFAPMLSYTASLIPSLGAQTYYNAAYYRPRFVSLQ